MSTITSVPAIRSVARAVICARCGLPIPKLERHVWNAEIKDDGIVRTRYHINCPLSTPFVPPPKILQKVAQPPVIQKPPTRRLHSPFVMPRFA